MTQVRIDIEAEDGYDTDEERRTFTVKTSFLRTLQTELIEQAIDAAMAVLKEEDES